MNTQTFLRSLLLPSHPLLFTYVFFFLPYLFPRFIYPLISPQCRQTNSGIFLWQCFSASHKLEKTLFRTSHTVRSHPPLTYLKFSLNVSNTIIDECDSSTIGSYYIYRHLFFVINPRTDAETTFMHSVFANRSRSLPITPPLLPDKLISL